MQYLQKKYLIIWNNQYTFDIESWSIKIKIKHWVESFFGAKIITMNSHRLSKKVENETYYETYDALQKYNHYASTGLFYFTFFRKINLKQNN